MYSDGMIEKVTMALNTVLTYSECAYIIYDMYRSAIDGGVTYKVFTQYVMVASV